MLEGKHLSASKENVMPEKLVQGDRFPTVELALTDGSRLTLPEEAPGRYVALIFYRGVW